MGLNASTSTNSAYKSYRLASYIADLYRSYDVVIIGSGYGGSIAASRTARAGKKVCLLERGKEWRPGYFPENNIAALSELQATIHNDEIIGSPTNLYDLTVSHDVTVLKGCGLGGTSLINANVCLEAEAQIFDDKVWPTKFREDLAKAKELDERRFRDMITPAAYPDPKMKTDQLPKLAAMELAAKYIADKEDLPFDKMFYKPPLYVNFEDKDSNHVGIPQPACINCGNCCGGCNTGAKNTLNMNYLPDAVVHGAKIFTEVEVTKLSRDEENDTWLVHYIYHGQKGFEKQERVVRAKVVILGAGSLGSTNILLQSKHNGLDVSPNVGKRFSTNGDTIGFSYNGEKEIRPVGEELRKLKKGKGPGPSIVSIIDMRYREDKNLKKSYVMEDGTAPCSIDLEERFLVSCIATKRDTQKFSWRQIARRLSGKAWQNTLALLVMSNDDAAGELRLDEKNDRVWIHYPGVGEEENLEAAKKGLFQATQALKGVFEPNPLWSGIIQKLRKTRGILSVHPIGGCAMAENGAEGVVNHAGQVFKDNTHELQQGLYVVDGAVMPRCLGINPSLTISTVAERCMRLMGDQLEWTIDYDSKKKFDFPRDPKPIKPGLRMTERMVGELSIGNSSSNTDFILTVESQDVEAMMSQDPNHSAGMSGTVNISKLSKSSLTASKGRFTLFSESEGHCQMTYRMVLSSNEGGIYYFDGIKKLHKDSPCEIGLKDTTTLFVNLHNGADEKGEVIGKGILHMKVEDFLEQLTTIHITNAPSEGERIKWEAGFGKFFFGSLWDIYGKRKNP